MSYKPFETEVARLGDLILTHSDYEDAEGFMKNWFEIYREINGEYISVHIISEFSYTWDGIRDYFIDYVHKMHHKETENPI